MAPAGGCTYSPRMAASSKRGSSEGSMRWAKVASTMTVISALGWSRRSSATASSSWRKLGRERPSVARCWTRPRRCARLACPCSQAPRAGVSRERCLPTAQEVLVLQLMDGGRARRGAAGLGAAHVSQLVSARPSACRRPCPRERPGPHVLWFFLEPDDLARLGVTRQHLCDLLCGPRVELLDANDRRPTPAPPRRGPGGPSRRRRPCRCTAPPAPTPGAGRQSRRRAPLASHPRRTRRHGERARAARQRFRRHDDQGPTVLRWVWARRRWKYCAAVVGWATVRLSLGADREKSLEGAEECSGPWPS